LSTDHWGQIEELLKSFPAHDRISKIPGIPAGKLSTARDSIVKNKEEYIFLVYDDTVWGSGKDGVVLTKTGIFYKMLWENPDNIPYDSIKSIERLNKFQFFINGEKKFSCACMGKEPDFPALDKMIEIIKVAAGIA